MESQLAAARADPHTAQLPQAVPHFTADLLGAFGSPMLAPSQPSGEIIALLRN